MIGWSWVILSGQWIKSAGSLGAMVAFFLGGVFTCLIGLIYAELTASMPEVGGEYIYVRKAMGEEISFVCAWAIILSYISVISFEAVALPTVIAYFIPGFQKIYLWTVAGSDVYLSWIIVGMFGSVVLIIVNIVGIKFAAFFQNVLSIVIILVGILFITGSLFNGTSSNMVPLFVKSWKGIFSVLIMTPMMYVGFNVIPQVAEETNIPSNSIGKLLVVSVIMAALFYILIILSVGRALPVANLNTKSLVTAKAMETVFKNKIAGEILVLGGIGGILTSWNAFYIGGSRIIYSLANSKMLPSFLGKIHNRYKTPINAILFIGCISMFAPLLGKSMLIWLLNVGGFSLFFAYTFVSLSFLILRYKEPDMIRPFVVPKGKVVGIITLISCLAILFICLPGFPTALLWPYEWYIILGWSMIGFVFYIWNKTNHRKSSKRFK